MIFFISIILPIGIFILSLSLLTGLKKLVLSKKSDNRDNNCISVVISFKDEEKNLKLLLSALDKINYPQDKYEIIFVDDNSTDNSAEIIKSSVVENFRLISAKDKLLPAKKGALEVGIENAKFEVIAITDADCKPESGWLKSISARIAEGYDIVFGYSPLVSEKNFVSKISSYENYRNYILYFSSAGLGLPYSATSRSIAFTKDSFYKLSGYRQTTDTLSGDDDLLIREAVKHKLRISAFRYRNDFVYSYPSSSFKEYFKRKSRHLKTSHHYLLRHKILLTLWHSINITSLFSVLFMPISLFFIIPFTTKFLADFIIIKKAEPILPNNFKIYEILYLQPIYEILLIVNFMNSLFRKDQWK